MEDVSFGLAFIAGLLSFFSPCVLPLVPAYIGYMGGRASQNVVLESAAKQKVGAAAKPNRAAMLLHGFAFVLGFTMVFVSIGIMTTAFVSVLGSAVGILTTIIGRVGGVLIILFGLHFMGALRRLFKYLQSHPQTLNLLTTLVVLVALSLVSIWAFVEILVALPVLAGLLLWFGLGGAFTQPQAFWLHLINSLEGAFYTDTRRDMDANTVSGLGGSFLMGVIFSAGWTPCIGPLLGTILTVSAQTGNVGLAIPMLTAYSMGLGIPFLLTAGLFEGAQFILRRLQKHLRKIEFFSGMILIGIGILVLTGQMQNISRSLSPEQIDFSTKIEECGIGFFRGELSFEQAGACINGTLKPVAFGQSAAGTLNANVPELIYLFTMEEAQVVDVEIRTDTPFNAIVQLVDSSNGTILVEQTGLTLLEDDKYLSISNFDLGLGTYQLKIRQSSTMEVEFRIKVRKAEATTNTTETTFNLEGLNSITSLAAASPETIGLDIGNRAPDFRVTTIEGESIALSDLQGQVVLLNFWGTWCGPCRREMPELQATYTAYQDKGFTILGLAVRDTEAAIQEFQADFELTFPLALDADDSITNLYAIRQQPSSIIINQEGVIVFKNFGIVLESQLAEVLDELLEG